MQELLSCHPEKLVVDPSHLGVGDINQIQMLREFLLWIGVAEWPREIEVKEGIPQDFLDYTLQHINYPAGFSDSISYKAVAEIKSDNPSFACISTLDHLDSILSANPAAVLAWLAHDPRADQWMLHAEKHGILRCLPKYKSNYRKFLGEIPSYVHWKIKITSWLPVMSGRSAPSDCIFEGAIEKIFPRPLPPSIDDMIAFGLDNHKLRMAWLRAGVSSDLSDIGSEKIYARLYELPSEDIEGKFAKGFYRKLLELNDFSPNTEGQNYQQFSKEGKILARRGNNKIYSPVKDVLYADIEGLPTSLTDNLTIADLPKKYGAEKVTRFFALNSIDRNAVTTTVKHHILASSWNDADIKFQASKRFIRVWRSSKSKYGGLPRQLDRFQSLCLCVCTKVVVVVDYNGQSWEHVLSPWHYVIQENVLYITCDPSRSYFSPALLANTLGEAIASVFELLDGSAFAQLYQCDELDKMDLLKQLLGEDAETVRALIESEGEPLLESNPCLWPPHVFSSDGEQMANNNTNSCGNPKLESEQIINKSNSENDLSSIEKVEFEKIESPLSVVNLDYKRQIPIKVCTPEKTASNDSDISNRKSSINKGIEGERLAEIFETQAGRFPLRVGHITGYQGPGCDVLSFKSNEDRTAFKDNENRDFSLIERFIEAKFSSGDSVELTDNEWKAAKERKERYFIYQFEGNIKDGYLLKSLCNPFTVTESHIHIMKISLNKSHCTERYKTNQIGEYRTYMSSPDRS